MLSVVEEVQAPEGAETPMEWIEGMFRVPSNLWRWEANLTELQELWECAVTEFSQTHKVSKVYTAFLYTAKLRTFQKNEQVPDSIQAKALELEHTLRAKHLSRPHLVRRAMYEVPRYHPRNDHEKLAAWMALLIVLALCLAAIAP